MISVYKSTATTFNTFLKIILGARMELVVHLAQPFTGDMSIDFGGTDTAVTEQLLYDA